MASSKLPAFQFYPSDWRSDIKVQSLSFHERGIWWEMLMIMHESEDRGKLVMNGKPMSDEMVSRLISCDLKTYRKCLATLLHLGVCYQDEGVIYNRRMVKDEQTRKARVSSGSMGGNPILLNQKDNQKEKETISKQSTKIQPLHSSSSTSYSNTHIATGDKSPEKTMEDYKTALNIRSDKFKDELLPFKFEYPERLLDEFFNYWTEPTPNYKKMRFEMQKTWDMSRRLATWFNKGGWTKKDVSIEPNRNVNRAIGTADREFGGA